MGLLRDMFTSGVDFFKEEIVPLRGELIKAGLLSPPAKNQFEPKANLVDSISYNTMQFGYKEKFSILDYGKMRQISYADPIIAAIIQTRTNQVAAFSRSQPDKYKIGFKVSLRDEARKPTKGEMKKSQEIEDFLLNCGYEDPMIETPDRKKRDSFEIFLRKMVRDSLTFDQCHPAGTLIETSNGLRPIEDIVVGDYVWTHEGRLRRVKEFKSRTCNDRLFTISLGGQSVRATAEHPFFCVPDDQFRFRRDQGPTWVKAEDIHPGHYLVYPKISLPEEEVAPLKIFGDVQRQFPNIPYTRIAEDLDIHPSTVAAIATGRYRKTGQVVNVVEKYLDTIGFKLWSQSVEPVAFDCDFAKFLGLYIAEGNVSGNTVRLTFHSDEHDLISFTEGWFESIGITSSRIEYDDRNGVTVMGSSAEMGRWLVDVCGTGSASMHIPKFIMSAPRTHKEAFLAGYLLGDGHFSTSRVSFTTTSLSLFGDIRTLCNSMGMLVKFHEKASYKENWLKQYGASLAGSVWRGIADRNGLPCSAVKRPHEPYLQDDKYYYVKVSSVSTSTADETPVFNFEVEDDHSYLADGVVSHNCNFEIVPRRNGIPAEFIAVDAATVKVVSDRLEQRDYNFGNTTSGDSTPYDYGYLSQANGSSKNQRTRKTTHPRLVQVVNGQIKATFDEWEMAMGIRNPRTDILANGYGFSEIEMIVMTITAHMNAETYNRKFFSQGSSIKGVITFEGMVPQDQLEAFRRQWHQQVSGVSNAWKTPIMALGKDNKMNWQSLHSTNREMEWGKYMEYLIKCICGTYQIDPLEIGFDIASHASGSGGGGGLGSLQKGYQLDRIIESKDKGLRPLLVFLSNILNEYIVWRIDPNFTLEFVGLNSRSEKDEVDLEKSKVETFKMIDEIRAENDLQPLPKPEDIKGPGQILLNPQYIQALTAWNQLKGIQDPNSMGAPGMGAPGQGGPGQDADSTATSSDGVPANQPGEPDYENMSTDELQSELDKLNGNTGDQKGKSNPQDKKLAPASVEKSLEFLL